MAGFLMIIFKESAFCLSSQSIMKVDYIIVGIGIAGISFCEQLRANGKTFVVFDDASQKSSTVAGGLYNPVVLKRFTSVWKSAEQLGVALPVYAKIEERLDIKIDYKIPVYRKFASLEEQNDWFVASDKPLLSKCLSPKIIKNDNNLIDAPFGFGEVLGTGRVDLSKLIGAYKSDLLKNNMLLKTPFNYEDLQIQENAVTYHDVSAGQIVFAEGFGVKQNPYFKYLPLAPVKGEVLIISAPDLKLDYVLKSGVFLIPLGEDLYYVGATYEWKHLNHDVTDRAKNQLLEKLGKLIRCSYNIVNHAAGIRPATNDRRPLVGQHYKHKSLYVLNGLGTRGVMVGPYVAQQLYGFIERNQPLEHEIDVKRYESLSQE